MYVFEGTLVGKVALVTGASRGIGRGIAEILVKCGATVYITGRKNTKGSVDVKHVSEELNKLMMGKCNAIYCDHYNDDEVDNVFKVVEEAHGGHLDLLVNNAFTGVTEMGKVIRKKFYELEPSFWDKICHVGLRSNYYCGVMAAKLMVKQGNGLIVNVSSIGGVMPLFGVAYSAGKEGTDRLSYEMGRELKKSNVCVISLWPGFVKTETMVMVASKKPDGLFGRAMSMAETPLFCGKGVAAIAADENKMRYTSRIIFTSDIGDHYHFCDEDGKKPICQLSLKCFLYNAGYETLAKFTPRFLRIPGWLFTAIYNKF